MQKELINAAKSLLNEPTAKNISLAILYLQTAQEITSIEINAELSELKRQVQAKKAQDEIIKTQS